MRVSLLIYEKYYIRTICLVILYYLDFIVLFSLLMINQLKSMAIFAQVAHLGSFRAVATSQGVSPSVISRHISMLEENLGEVLLSRSTRKLALTSVGERFLVHCDKMLEAANEGVTSVKENVNQGHLRITLPNTLATPSFGRLIENFRKTNPLVDFSLIFDDDYVDIVEQGVDIALRLGKLEDSSLKSKRVANIHRSMVCTPQYLSGISEMVKPTDLSRCHWIGRRNPSVSPILYSLTGQMYTVPKQPRFIQVNSVEAIRALVLSNNGIGLFPDMLVERELEKGVLVRILPEWRVESLFLYAVWSAHRTTGQLVKKFVDFLVNELGEL